MDNIKKIYTTLPNGTKIEYNIIATIYNEKNNKNYVIYTDNTLDQNKKIRIYAAIYDPINNNQYQGEPKTKEEWTYISNVLNQIIPQM